MSDPTDLYKYLGDVWASNPEYVALSAVSAAAALGIIWGIRELYLMKERKIVAQYIPKRRERMLRRERIKFVDGLVANVIMRGLEKEVWDQTLTRFEVNEQYRKLSLKSGNTIIMPGILSLTMQLKAAQKKKKLHPAATTPPNANKAGNVVPLRAAFGDKSIRRQKRA